MTRIHALDPATVARIAAGEVIDRPAAVVRELLDNSVDAGATRIDVELEAGGVDLIRVVDDGHGIHPDDLPLTFANHATSKLRTADELMTVGTLGFRGEALASVGGVARVLLQSRRADRPHGAEVRCDGGTLEAVRPWNGPTGTRVEVRHLFAHVPARRKFLKGHATELQHVCEAVTRLALARPTLHLTLRHNGKLVWEVPPLATLPDRLGLFFGREVREALLEVDSGPGPVRLWGYVADPACDRGSAKLQHLFVNGRWFRDRSLGHALQEAYRGLLMVGRYPIGVLFLAVPPEAVDVNVHPAKAEVRFREPSVTYSLVRGVVKARLLKASLVPAMTAPEPPVLAGAATARERLATATPELPSPPAGRSLAVAAPTERSLAVAAVPTEPAAPPLPDFPVPSLPPGATLQVHDTYLIQETPEGMVVIDQHALHERILYEQLRQRVRDGKLEVQRLLIPEPIDLSAEQAGAVLDAAPELASLGLEVSEFGGSTVLLSSYPTLLSRRAPHEILNAVVDHLTKRDRPPSREALFNDLLATMACKAAVKAGDRLTADEIAHLLHLRQLAEDSHHCPHGRPTSLLFSRKELDRQFRRV